MSNSNNLLHSLNTENECTLATLREWSKDIKVDNADDDIESADESDETASQRHRRTSNQMKQLKAIKRYSWLVMKASIKTMCISIIRITEIVFQLQGSPSQGS